MALQMNEYNWHGMDVGWWVGLIILLVFIYFCLRKRDV